ncbi:2-oxo acid dehydrogenase subunit E2 [Pseudonocardia bannensis]|uniref:Dihydrolipoamide acetyltransferase component of pyruvate dehydrogenase complex n=1 Tax=Pseudonocardia bannensis TaxID=630973 RepID=A0A848DF60_9PSEU|nr:2-oxo acid dehydrogenase subunit E2 [Pseudonocardia bannensis]NMH91204.1 2-oxo acid dehydrogenase subunit E2 [Pseudonocardia bannensis]
MAEFRMPSLGADMESGTVLEWLVGPGDQVRRGDVVAVVDTDKAAIDVECFDSGVIERLLVQPGEKVSVGTPLALIAATGADAGPAPPETAARPRETPPPAPHPAALSPLVRRRAAEAGLDIATLTGTGPGGVVTAADVDHALHPAVPVAAPLVPSVTPGPPEPVVAAAPGARIHVSPYARRLAAERGVDPTVLRGSGPDGVVHARDVPAVPAPVVTNGAGPAPVAATALRRATAALMARSKREIPHYYLALDIDLGPALDWLRAHNRAIPVAARVLPAAVLLRAVVLAAQAVPELNGHWIDDRFVPGRGVQLGVAVSLRGGGLVVPVIRDAGTLGLDDLMARVREGGERARTGRLRSSEAGGATITVTNLGELGVDAVDGVIHPPQVALVGFGAVRPRPWAAGDAVLVRPVVTATLSADHRATDGALGARLLREIDRRLRRPEEL